MFFNGIIHKQSVGNKSVYEVMNPSSVYSEQASSLKNQDGNFMNKNELYSYVRSLRKGQRHMSSAKHASSELINFSKNNKTLIQPVIQKQILLIQNYLGSHNKFKTYFKSKKYKKIYSQLSKQIPMQKSYYPLYMQDKLYSLNKHLKVSLVHKQTSFSQYLGPYFAAGKQLIQDFYHRFLADNQLFRGTKKVDSELLSAHQQNRSCNPSKFFYIVITFLHQLAIFHRSKGQRKQAQTHYEANLKIIHAILRSSTSSCRLRRKICQNLLSFSSFLIQGQQLQKAYKILAMALNNSINLVGIIEAKLFYADRKKNKANITDNTLQKYQKRNNIKLKEAFKFMIAIYLNSAVIFQLQKQQHLSYFALDQARYLQQILYKRYSIKTRITEVIKKPKQAYDYRCEEIRILQSYFDFKLIIKNAKQNKQLNQNVNVGIYGIKSFQQKSNNKQKSIQQLFFKVKVQQSLNKKYTANTFTQKIALIQYANEIDVQDEKSADEQYIINTKKTNGSLTSTIYNQTKSANQKAKYTLKEDDARQSNTQKLSKFYKQDKTEDNNSRQQIISQSNNDSDCNIQSFRHQKKSTYFKANNQKMVSKQISRLQQSKFQNDPKFLDKFIQSQLSSKNYFLYGKQFVQNYNLISEGKTCDYKRSSNKQKSKTTNSETFTKLSDMKYVTKNQIQVIFGKDNNKSVTQTNKNAKKRILAKKKRISTQNFQSKSQDKLLSTYIVKQESNDYLQQNQMQDQGQKMSGIFKKRSITALKNEPMNYKDIMQRIQTTQNQFLKRDYIQKNSIYRLKCRSQNSSKKKYGHNHNSLDTFAKSSNIGLQHENNKKQNQRQLIRFKPQKSQSVSRFMLIDQGKGQNLTKKGLIGNMFSNNQTGIRLLKKIVFKHKKTLKITKPDLFVNYNKMQACEKDIKLVQRQSYLKVQYNMCEQETKARIKQNMQQLIFDNLRNSQQNQKRVQKINKAISDYDKNKRLKQFTTKIQQSNDSESHIIDKILMVPNPNYFAGTFNGKYQQQGQVADKSDVFADHVIKRIFQSRAFFGSKQLQFLGFGDQKLLTSNKINNPDLFLSSIKYKQEQRSDKKLKNFRNTSNSSFKGQNNRNQTQDNNLYKNKDFLKKKRTLQLEDINASGNFAQDQDD